MISLPELEKLAKAATQPGPWAMREDFRGADERRCMVIDRDDMWVADCGNDDENSSYIAAVSPDVVLALIARIAALEYAYAEVRYWSAGHTDKVRARIAEMDAKIKEGK